MSVAIRYSVPTEPAYVRPQSGESLDAVRRAFEACFGTPSGRHWRLVLNRDGEKLCGIAAALTCVRPIYDLLTEHGTVLVELEL